jgi:hypothetical protein
VIFHILTAANMMTVSGDVVPCNLAETYRSFRGADDGSGDNDDGARMMEPA